MMIVTKELDPFTHLSLNVVSLLCSGIVCDSLLQPYGDPTKYHKPD